MVNILPVNRFFYFVFILDSCLERLFYFPAIFFEYVTPEYAGWQKRR
jgi:hypothetical protein